MKPDNVLSAKNRNELRQWLEHNHLTEKECWVAVKRGRPTSDDVFWYVDAVEEALCFGWIDSTTKTLQDGVTYQKLAPRKKGSLWSELNKERCRRMDKSAEKIKLTSYDDLFGSSEVTAEEKIVSVPIRLFHTFKDHPFRVLDDEKMQETVESVKRYGILMPGIVRPYGDGEYEMVAGHRRWRACELAGMEEMPVIIREMDDDTATVIMVDTNIQREDILPSEKAHAYKMKYEAMKHQGSKGEKHTADLVGEAAGESGRTVQRYIRLSFLISRLLDYVDNKRLSMKAGEKLSFLTVEEQEWVLEAIDNAVLTVTDKQAELFKNHSREKTLNQGIIYSVLLQKKEAETKVTLSAKKVRSYFPPAYTKEQVEEVIYTLLEQWRKKKGKEEQEDAGDTV